MVEVTSRSGGRATTQDGRRERGTGTRKHDRLDKKKGLLLRRRVTPMGLGLGRERRKRKLSKGWPIGEGKSNGENVKS